jgi:hypothetical protein
MVNGNPERSLHLNRRAEEVFGLIKRPMIRSCLSIKEQRLGVDAFLNLLAQTLYVLAYGAATPL